MLACVSAVSPASYYFVDMNEKRKPYPFDQIEPKWQAVWAERKTFRTPNPGDADFDASKPKFYVLDMFPYPSGAGLHVGHPEGYTATDILCAVPPDEGGQRPPSDGLGCVWPARRAVRHPDRRPPPRERRSSNVDNFRRQINRSASRTTGTARSTPPTRLISAGRSGSSSLSTLVRPDHEWIDPRRHGQGRPIADCPSHPGQRSAVRDERPAFAYRRGSGQLVPGARHGAGQRGGHRRQERGRRLPRSNGRPMRQWMLRITAYAERLIKDLDGLDWPESIKRLQRNWIGRSEGAARRLQPGISRTARRAWSRWPRHRQGGPPADDAVPEATRAPDGGVTVFTTRPDTLFGATYMVLSPRASAGRPCSPPRAKALPSTAPPSRGK